MLLKQASIQTCSCGAPISFPDGEVKAKCGCGANWECGSEGFWSIKNITTPMIPQFAPILAKPKHIPEPFITKSSRYENYMGRRKKNDRKRRRK